MKQQQSFKYSLKTNPADERKLSRFAGCCRFVYNRALTLQKTRHDSGEKHLSYMHLCRELTKWRHMKGLQFLAVAPAHPLQQKLKDLERAYRNFFQKRAEYPRLKKKNHQDSFSYPDVFKIDQSNCRIFLPKIGWVLYRKSREFQGTPKNLTVSRQGNRWFVSVQTEREVIQPVHPSISMVGIDLGVANFATLSDGSMVAPLNSFKKHEKRLAFLQRRMSRKKKFSANWKKANGRVARCHAKIGNVRKDFLHKISTTISKNHAVVVVEKLKVANMSKSAKGTKASPGRNLRAKAGLNRAILDQGWGEFRRQLGYKLAWQGGRLVEVDPRNTSRGCAMCGHIAAENRVSQAVFRCGLCGHTDHADVNAARNILAAGQAVIACGESAPSGRSTKQEPTERASASIAA